VCLVIGTTKKSWLNQKYFPLTRKIFFNFTVSHNSFSTAIDCCQRSLKSATKICQISPRSSPKVVERCRSMAESFIGFQQKSIKSATKVHQKVTKIFHRSPPIVTDFPYKPKAKNYFQLEIIFQSIYTRK
jgi:hypothetical protein